MPVVYEIEGRDLTYFRESGKVYQNISIYRHEIATDTQEILSESLLYENVCEIAYPLSDETKIIEKRGAQA